ncbi:YqzE-like protein [Oceanobacillus limi]|uniref:YqzE-like protein n=1 Tax=Oceanobacillus limi TaxID=930131 RepID=A0A1H9ZR96_9BACI|nr:YqzE family protein [Oceanobacillus limi]SES83326.1 YqzE-like protein [Oceanobacillus limi]
MSNDYIRQMTERVVSYMDLPADERRKKRKEHKTKKQQTGVNRWFGVLPQAIRISFKKDQ